MKCAKLTPIFILPDYFVNERTLQMTLKPLSIRLTLKPQERYFMDRTSAFHQDSPLAVR